jgi:ADP-heptose:LPS heptosyltransferase
MRNLQKEHDAVKYFQHLKHRSGSRTPADVVITGDSFGMHLAIALKKFVIAWFGLSCWTEIDLYDRGEKLYTAGLFCAPCWKKECPHNLECIQMIDLDRIVGCVGEYASRRSSNQDYLDCLRKR